MKRKPSMAVVPAERNVEIRLAVTKWKLYTGKTQQDLADQLGIPPSYLCDILYAGGQAASTSRASQRSQKNSRRKKEESECQHPTNLYSCWRTSGRITVSNSQAIRSRMIPESFVPCTTCGNNARSPSKTISTRSSS